MTESTTAMELSKAKYQLRCQTCDTDQENMKAFGATPDRNPTAALVTSHGTCHTACTCERPPSRARPTRTSENRGRLGRLVFFVAQGYCAT